MQPHANSSSEAPPADWMQRAGLWVAIVTFSVLLALPAPSGLPPEAHRLLAATALMTILWVTQALPIAVTSLIPIVLYPLLAITPAESVAKAYMNDSILLYLGGFILAIAIERWGLHRRWALHVVRVLGTGPKRLLLGFMLATAFASMWISNTATTLMMLPIGLAMLSAFEACLERDSQGSVSAAVKRQKLARLSAALPLGIAYASSCGGMATYVGTPTNLVFRSEWEAIIKTTGGEPVSSAEWMMCCLPIAVLMTLCAWLVLGFRLKPIPGAEHVGRDFFTARLKELGPPSREETAVAVLFLITACLWVLRLPLEFGDTALVPGWGPLVSRWLIDQLGADPVIVEKSVSDATVAIMAAILMFVIPARKSDDRSAATLLDWEFVERRLPWGIILLFGGGFAMADAFKETGLSAWLGSQLAPLGGMPTVVLIGCICMMMVFLSEFASNVAITTTMLPIVASLAAGLEIDPRVLMIPATVAASCGFMLPVATPPNAIAFSTGHISVRQMAVAGLWLNLIGTLVVTLCSAALLGPVLGVKW